MSRHGNRDNFRDYEEGDHLEWNISRWWAQNLCQLLEYSRLESTFTTSALSVLLSPQPVWLFIASHLLHQLTLFHTRHLVPLILIAWCSWEIKDLYFIGPFCLLTESKPVTNAAILRFELFTGLSLWGPLGPGRVTGESTGDRRIPSQLPVIVISMTHYTKFGYTKLERTGYCAMPSPVASPYKGAICGAMVRRKAIPCHEVKMLTHWGRVTHICARKLCHHWIR